MIKDGISESETKGLQTIDLVSQTVQDAMHGSYHRVGKELSWLQSQLSITAAQEESEQNKRAAKAMLLQQLVSGNSDAMNKAHADFLKSFQTADAYMKQLGAKKSSATAAAKTAFEAIKAATAMHLQQAVQGFSTATAQELQKYSGQINGKVGAMGQLIIGATGDIATLQSQ